MPWRGGERPVAGHHCRIERLGEGEIHRIVRRKVLPQLPRPSREIEMPMTSDPQQCQVLDRFFRALGKDLARMHESPQGAEDLHVEKMRSVKVIIVPVDPPLDTDPKLRLEQQLGDCRGVDDDQADPRSFRIASAAGVLSFTRVRAWSRASISSRVGRAAIRSISASR